MEAERFAKRLRELREAKGWTQVELAQHAGLTRDGVAHLEQGRRSPAWETVLAIARALGVSCEAFNQEPADREPAAPGRPRKPEVADQVEADVVKKPGKADATGTPAKGKAAKGTRQRKEG